MSDLARRAGLFAMATVAAVGLATAEGCSLLLDYSSLDRGAASDGAPGGITDGAADAGPGNGGVAPDGAHGVPADGAADAGPGTDGVAPDGAHGGPADGAADAGPGTDGVAPDGPIVDAGPRCDPTKDFAAPLVPSGPIDQPNTNEVSGRLTQDELTLYFARDNGTGNSWTIFVATRADTSDPFSTPTAVLIPNTSTSDTDPMLLRDGLTMYLSALHDDAGHGGIFMSRRPDAGSPFGPLASVDALQVAEDVGQPFFLADDVTLYFADEYDNALYTAVAQSGSFTVPAQLSEITANAQFPVATADNRSLFYRNIDADQIWTATRSAPGTPFQAPHAVPLTVTSGTGYAPTWVSDDGCHMVF